MASTVNDIEEDSNDIEIISGPASGTSESPVMVPAVQSDSNGSDLDLEVSQILNVNQDAKPDSDPVIEAALNLADDVKSDQPDIKEEIEKIESIVRDDDIDESKLTKKDEISSGEAEEVPKKDSPVAPKEEPSLGVVSTAKKDEDEWVDKESDDEEEEYEETMTERLIGLTEMFPASLRSGVCSLTSGSLSATKGLYQLTRKISWVVFTTAAILFAPIAFEVERGQMLEMEKQQQRAILLGPGAAVSGGPQLIGGGMAPPPPK
ncbi:uncharacterized protein LOC136039849 [Artemia franciscana]|uniref:Mitochondrial import receptor subunit TOM22 homolog n=1 Tax=Artemia franciscana TaxID=6661 RepID=A0AA88L301_ARTSF|nr:hypothetical protein QYM36_009014 [Artemia franciscana]